MAKMIPSFIKRDDSKRTGEYMVYDWLAKDDVPGIAFYSHPQNNHEKKTMSEVDFLYICTDGILCIEVKGGYIEKHEKWTSKAKSGVVYEIQNPFSQSHGCMKAIAATLENTYGKKSIESKFCVGSAVVFPECIANCDGDSVIKEVMFDGRKELSDFSSFLKNSLKYWSNILYLKQGKRTIALSEEQVTQMVTLFSADFGAVPSMKLLIDTTYEEMLKLTEEQCEVLNSIDENKRVLVFGAAGTGKSILAVAKLKQNISKRKKTAYICFNRNMASYVEQNVKSNAEAFIGTYHSLLKQYIADSYDYEIDDLNHRFLDAEIVPKESYDMLIIDEAQDLLTESTIKVLSYFLNGGMKTGEWIFFADPNQDIFMQGKNFETVINKLKEDFNPCVQRLFMNCRNTAQIARRNSMLTSTPPTKYMHLSGPDVVGEDYTDKDDFYEKIDKKIRSLLAGGNYVKDIMILSPKKLENSLLAGKSTLAGVDLVEVRSYKGIKNSQINYMTVQSFKGLESKIVFYIDIDGFEDMKYRRMNYVAMSRAQIVLYYYYDKKLEEEYENSMVAGMTILSQNV